MSMSGYWRVGEKSRSMEAEAEAEAEEGMRNGERFGVILARSASSSSSSSSRFHVTMKKAFSTRMRRSSSVSERYCRIHDQHTPMTSPIPDHHQISNNKKILKACKRLLRL
ncbi:hypothetical protein VNO78_03455 [Psophocarpus tetragonolobus]|uniref:Uncharacterized protein n=1 Tax=Psophocarpus tetragonolobus TaxID=3891 RepID=A0AAN9T178_PSOTE